jgi:hypothetical protein
MRPGMRVCLHVECALLVVTLTEIKTCQNILVKLHTFHFTKIALVVLDMFHAYKRKMDELRDFNRRPTSDKSACKKRQCPTSVGLAIMASSTDTQDYVNLTVKHKPTGSVTQIMK